MVVMEFGWHQNEIPPKNVDLLFNRIPKNTKYKVELFVGRYTERGEVTFPYGSGESFKSSKVTYKWSYIPD